MKRPSYRAPTFRLRRLFSDLLGGGSGKNFTRRKAAIDLGNIGDPNAVGPLIYALHDNDSGVRGSAAEALGKIGHPKAAKPLIDALRSNDTELLVSASTALGKLADQRAVTPLGRLTHHLSPAVRAATAEALGNFIDPVAVKSLVKLLDDGDELVLERARGSLSRIGEPAIKPLTERLRDANEQVRRQAGKALVKIGGTAFEGLFAALKHPDPNLRALAASSLGFYEHPKPFARSEKSPGKPVPCQEVAAHLLTVLDDPDFRVRLAASHALTSMYSYVPKWILGDDSGREKIAEVLFTLLGKRSEPARLTAAEALLAVTKDPLPVMRALAHEDAQVRLAMVRAIDGYLAGLNATVDFFPSWFSVMRDFYHVWLHDSAEQVINALVRGSLHDADSRVRAACMSTLSTVRTKLWEKRVDGQLDIVYSWNGPLPASQLETETAEERYVTAAMRKVGVDIPPPRYADLNFYSERSVSARIPEGQALQTEKWYQLEVAIRVKPIGIPVQSMKLRAVPEVTQQGEVTIWVAAEGDGFELDEPVQTLVLPPSGDSTKNAWFRVRPLRKSTGPENLAEIQIRLYYEFNLLEVDVIRAEIVGKFDDPARPALGLEKPLFFRQERVEHDYQDLVHLQPRAMHIDIEPRGDCFLFRFAFRNAVNKEIVFTAPVDLRTPDLEDCLVSIRKLWYDIAMSETFGEHLEGDREEYVSCMRRLAAAGQGLWVKLFKEKQTSALYQIGEWLARHPMDQDAIIQISAEGNADRFVFPWNLLYDRPLPGGDRELPDPFGFWGIRYCIEQNVSKRSRTADALSDTGKRVRGQTSVNVGFMLWEQFRNADQEKALFDRLEACSSGRLNVTRPPLTDAKDCFSLLGECHADMLYFYTHGYSRHRQADIGVGPNLDLFMRRYERLRKDSPLRDTYRMLFESIKQEHFEPDRSWIELSTGKIYLSELYEYIRSLNSEPFVFLNMCESAQVTPSLSDSFIHFFLDRGARGVVGTECPMTVEFAHPFAERVLTGLLKGQPAGKVLLDARRHFLDLSNPLGLAYTFFGSVTASIQPTML